MRQNWQMWSGVLKDEKILAFKDAAKRTVTQRDGNDNAINDDVVAVLSSNFDLLSLLHDYADLANQNAFGINFYKKASIFYKKQSCSKYQKLNRACDVDWESKNNLDPKLTVIVQLTDPEFYKGGDFIFSDVENPNSQQLKNKGTIIVFPSYLQTYETEIELGTRESIIAFFYGPRWV